MNITRTRILIFISQIVGFEDLLFEELEPLLEFLEIRDFAANTEASRLTGYSIVFDGQLETSEASYARGDILIHTTSDLELRITALTPTVLINFSAPSIEAFLRKEPELGMLLLEHLGQEDNEDQA